MARYPQGILVACPSPWDDRDELIEELLREEVRLVLAAGFEHCYVFGTGGEGYAVDTRRFRQVVDVFHEEVDGAPVSAMVGVIGLSSVQIVERLEYATTSASRMFQISLPSWGPLADDEVLRFFSDVCGAFPDSRFPALQPSPDEARPDRSRLRAGSSRSCPTSWPPRPRVAGWPAPRS